MHWLISHHGNSAIGYKHVAHEVQMGSAIPISTTTYPMETGASGGKDVVEGLHQKSCDWA